MTRIGVRKGSDPEINRRVLKEKPRALQLWRLIEENVVAAIARTYGSGRQRDWPAEFLEARRNVDSVQPVRKYVGISALGDRYPTWVVDVPWRNASAGGGMPRGTLNRPCVGRKRKNRGGRS